MIEIIRCYFVAFTFYVAFFVLVIAKELHPPTPPPDPPTKKRKQKSYSYFNQKCMFRNRRVRRKDLFDGLYDKSGNIAGRRVAKRYTDLALFYFVNFRVTLFLFSVFFYFLFSTKRWCYVFIIPITLSDHIRTDSPCSCSESNSH